MPIWLDSAYAERAYWAGMKLGEYLKGTGTTQEAFAALLGEKQWVVSRWVTGKRMPGKEKIRRIFGATQGEVDANAFYDLPAPKKCKCPPKSRKKG
jgi:transcriptional regulator with XRE-family HTH domain